MKNGKGLYEEFIGVLYNVLAPTTYRHNALFPNTRRLDPPLSPGTRLPECVYCPENVVHSQYAVCQNDEVFGNVRIAPSIM